MCVGCGIDVPKAKRTCRNHCPVCFASLHVDGDIPWDRSTECHGIMYPTAYKVLNSDYKILFTCSKCGKEHWNKRAVDDKIVNLPELIKKYKKEFTE